MSNVIDIFPYMPTVRELLANPEAYYRRNSIGFLDVAKMLRAVATNRGLSKGLQEDLVERAEDLEEIARNLTRSARKLGRGAL